jgi:hypothetical protein
LSRLLVLLRSDTHGGHKLGLLSPATVIQDEDEDGDTVPYTPALTKTQRWLWDIQQSALARTATLAHRDPVVSLHLGDLTHGVKYPQQLVTNSISNQILIAIANEQSTVDTLPTLQAIRIIEGTDSHEFSDATSPTLVATYLQSAHPSIDTQVYRHHLLTIGSTSLDLAHHGPHPGSRNWLKGNTARYYLRSLMMDCLDIGQPVPTLVIRGHRHTFIAPVTERIYRDRKIHTSTLILLPPLCGISRFARQVTQSQPILTVGLLVLEIIDGQLHRTYPFIQTKDMRSKETLCLNP